MLIGLCNAGISGRRDPAALTMQERYVIVPIPIGGAPTLYGMFRIRKTASNLMLTFMRSHGFELTRVTIMSSKTRRSGWVRVVSRIHQDVLIPVRCRNRDIVDHPTHQGVRHESDEINT